MSYWFIGYNAILQALVFLCCIVHSLYSFALSSSIRLTCTAFTASPIFIIKTYSRKYMFHRKFSKSLIFPEPLFFELVDMNRQMLLIFSIKQAI
uniref:Putative secreted protein n=1 Tax=Ixodes ricinus TaxID=34613 RepID=A0A6B0UCS5_IXORI